MKKFIQTAADFAKGIGERKLTLYATSGTYYIFMALVPTLLLIVSLLQFTSLTPEYIMAQIMEFLPEQVTTLLDNIIFGIYRDGGAAFTISIILTLWSASASMRAIMNGLNSCYDLNNIKQNAVRFYLCSLLYMVIFVVALIVSFIILGYGAAILRLVQKVLAELSQLPGFSEVPRMETFAVFALVTRYLRYVVVMAFLFAVFMFLYTFVPAVPRRFRQQWPGALFASASWVLFSFVFSFYVGVSNKWGVYGIIGTVMVAMMWLNFSILFLLIGAWINRFLELRKIASGEKI